jgi:hypothetical protein
MAALPKLAEINKQQKDPVVRHDAVMKMDGLFEVVAAE